MGRKGFTPLHPENPVFQSGPEWNIKFKSMKKPRAKGWGVTGFTLIELMLVVIIIGVLAAMVMPRFVGRSEQARIAASRSDIANISLALDLFEMDMGYFPASLEDLREKGSNPDTWKGPYLKKKPVDPWGRVYEYKAKEAGEDYLLCSKGPDEAKQEDDVCNDAQE